MNWRQGSTTLQDLEDTTEDLAEGNLFLADLGVNRENTEKEREEYKKLQGQELPALADTICLNDGYGDFELETVS